MRFSGGSEGEIFADYRQWEQFQAAQQKPSEAPEKKTVQTEPKAVSEKRSRKMTYAEKREWEQMEEKILTTEAEIQELQKQLHDPVMASKPQELQDAYKLLDEKQRQLDQLYHRWEELESLMN